MRVYRCLTALPLIGGLMFAGDSTYQDPQHRFTISVPQGWMRATADASLQLARGNASVTLFWMDGDLEAGAMLQQVVQQISTQWKDLRPVGSSQVMFGGQVGSATVVTGTNPKGVPSFAAVMAASAGVRSYAMIESGPMSDYRNLSAEMDRIAGSFAIGGVPAGVGRSVPVAAPPANAGQAPGYAGQPPAGGSQSPQDQQMTRALAGRWTFYQASRVGVGVDGSSSKEYIIDGNGRFLYKAAVYVNANLPVDVNPVTEKSGSYRVLGNIIYYRLDSGESGSTQFQFLEGGKGLQLGGEVYIRE